MDWNQFNKSFASNLEYGLIVTFGIIGGFCLIYGLTRCYNMCTNNGKHVCHVCQRSAVTNNTPINQLHQNNQPNYQTITVVS